MAYELDLDSVARDVLEGPGYHVVPGMLNEAQLDEIKAEIERLRHEDNPGFFPDKTNRERIFGLVYEARVFQDVIVGPLDIVRTILGTQHVSLSGFSAHVVKPGTGSIGMHVDYPYGSIQEPLPLHPVLGLQLIWAIDQFDENNGATVFCPGSQLSGRRPPRPMDSETEVVQLVAPAGSLIVAHCMCWHDSGENRSQGNRIGLLGNYTPNYVRPIEYPYFEFRRPPEDIDPEAASLIGLAFYDSIEKAVREEDRSEVPWRKKRKDA